MAKRAVIIDTDVNMDDAQAILWLLKRPDIDIKAITVTGTGWCSLGAGLTNIFGMLAFLGREDIPVTWGSPYALYELETGDYGCTYAKSVPVAPIGRLWSDTLMGLARCFPRPAADRFYDPNAPTAPELIARLLNTSSTPIDILALGPATTIATLLSDHPWAKSRIGRVVFSGGAVYAAGNLFFPYGNPPNAYAEYNAYGDPEALAQVVLSGVNVTLVPLDATGRLIVTQAYLDAIKTDLRTPEARWVDALLLTLQQQMGPVFDGYSLWDPYAAAVLVDQERYAANVTTVPITVVTQAVNVSEAGRTMPDLHGAPIDVVLSANDLIFDDLFAYYNARRGRSCSRICS
jgi:inosine-uridine nucleoside N-ribohydrolase